MQNKTDSWLDDALDRVPSQEVPPQFRQDLERRLRQEGLRRPASSAGATDATTPRILQFARAGLTAAAAALLLMVGYQLGAGGDNQPAITIAPESEIADAELIELYELRDVIESWELAADADLEPGFVADESAWVESVLNSEDSQ